MTAVLLLSCPDQHGIVAATAQFLAAHNGNIVHAEQHVDASNGGATMFFQRIEFELDGFGSPARTSGPSSPRSPNGSRWPSTSGSPTCRRRPRSSHPDSALSLRPPDAVAQR